MTVTKRIRFEVLRRDNHVCRYCHAVDVPLPGLPPVDIDGITELWFDDADGIGAVFGSQNYLEQIRPDEEKFIDLPRCQFLVSTENVLIA